MIINLLAAKVDVVCFEDIRDVKNFPKDFHFLAINLNPTFGRQERLYLVATYPDGSQKIAFVNNLEYIIAVAARYSQEGAQKLTAWLGPDCITLSDDYPLFYLHESDL